MSEFNFGGSVPSLIQLMYQNTRQSNPLSLQLVERLVVKPAQKLNHTHMMHFSTRLFVATILHLFQDHIVYTRQDT